MPGPPAAFATAAYTTAMVLKASGPTPIRLLVLSFVGLVAIGALLLKTPLATPDQQPIGWLDAVFTATSAACVTGLAVRDTASGFTLFGQAIILGLIQLGGLGVMTFWIFLYRLLGGRVSLGFRSVFEHTLSGAAGDHVWPLLRLVFRFTFGCELAGAVLLWLRWAPEQGAVPAAWSALFHSVSAFCNAGFGLHPDSLMRYAADWWVNAVIMLLVICGGLGFFVVFDVFGRRRRPGRRLSLHTRLALLVTVALLVLGAAAFWALELHNTLADLDLGEQCLVSLFQSTSPRTAGFNTVDLARLQPATLFLMVLLMAVGGSPGSCAGGIKTTTLGVLLLTAWARLRGSRQVNVFYRSLDAGTINGALTVASWGALASVLGLFALLLAEHSAGGAHGRDAQYFLAYLFETVSAIGTVGLSTGITPQLSAGAKLIVALLMLVGRLGPVTVAAALARERVRDDWEYAREGVMVG